MGSYKQPLSPIDVMPFPKQMVDHLVPVARYVFLACVLFGNYFPNKCGKILKFVSQPLQHWSDGTSVLKHAGCGIGSDMSQFAVRVLRKCEIIFVSHCVCQNFMCHAEQMF